MENYKLAIFVATGYEDTELITSIDLFNRAGLKFDLISVENKDMIKGSYNVFVETIKAKTIKVKDYQGFFFPGGAGVKLLDKSKIVDRAIKYGNEQKLDLFAICAAPELLLKRGSIKNRPFTSYPGTCEVENNTRGPLEIVSNIITAKSLQYSVPFALAIIEKTLGKGKRMEVKKKI